MTTYNNKCMCQICGNYYLKISNSHLKKHKTTLSQYKKDFPDAMMVSEYTRKIMSKKISLGKKGKSSSLKGRERSADFRQKIKDTHWSKKPMNEQEHIREKLRENGRRVAQYLVDNDIKYKFTTESSKKIWADPSHRKNISDMLKARTLTDETKKKILDNHWSTKSDYEVRDIVDRVLGKNKQYKNSHKGMYYSAKSGHEMFYASSYELKRLKHLETNVLCVKFTTKHKIQIQYVIDGKPKKYIPDILVHWSDGSVTLEEIKGYVRDVDKFEAKKHYAEAFCEKHQMIYRVLYKKDLEI